MDSKEVDNGAGVFFSLLTFLAPFQSHLRNLHVVTENTGA